MNINDDDRCCQCVSNVRQHNIHNVAVAMQHQVAHLQYTVRHVRFLAAVATIITSTKEVMFSPVSVCLSVC